MQAERLSMRFRYGPLESPAHAVLDFFDQVLPAGARQRQGLNRPGRAAVVD
jgi:hypothetical protein